MSLTVDEWRKLPEDERRRRYKEMDSHNMFLERVGGSNKKLTPKGKETQKVINAWIDEMMTKHGHPIDK